MTELQQETEQKLRDIACKNKTNEVVVENNKEKTEIEKPPKKQRPSALKKGKFFTVDDKQMLYGGKDSTQHFDITN